MYTLPRSLTWSRIALIILTIFYSLSSGALAATSTAAAYRVFIYAEDKEHCQDFLCKISRPNLYLQIAFIAFIVHITTALVALNTARSRERKRLLSGRTGVSIERLSHYVLRAVLFTLVLYAVAIWIGWNGSGVVKKAAEAVASKAPSKSEELISRLLDDRSNGNATEESKMPTKLVKGIFAQDFVGKHFKVTTATTYLLHATTATGALLAGLAAGLARPAPPEESLKPISPGTIDPDVPTASLSRA